MKSENNLIQKYQLENLYIQFVRVIARLAQWMLTCASACTSVVGAKEMVSEYKLVAAGLALGLNVTLFTSAHQGNHEELLPTGYKYLGLLRLNAWMICLVFSSWLSFVGFFKLYREQVITDKQNHAVQTSVHDASTKLNQLRSDGLGYLNAQIPQLDSQIVTETRRIEFAKLNGRNASLKQLDRLKAQKRQLDSAAQQLIALRLLDSSKLVGESNTARQELFDAFQRAAQAHALLPEEFRQQHPLPQPAEEQPITSNLQNLAWDQLKNGVPFAWFLLFVAFALDLVPTLSVRAQTPVRRVSRLIKDGRWRLSEMWHSTFGFLSGKTDSVRLEIENYPELDVEIVFGDEVEHQFLSDLQSHFESVERKVSAINDEEMQVASVMSPSGAELSPNLPISKQLNKERTIILRLEPVFKEEVEI